MQTTKSDRELESLLIKAAGEQKAPPKSPVLKRRHTVAQANKTASNWALSQFDVVLLTAELHKHGIDMTWHVGQLVGIVEDAATPPATKLTALAELRRLTAVAAGEHSTVKQSGPTSGNGSESAADLANPFLHPPQMQFADEA